MKPLDDPKLLEEPADVPSPSDRVCSSCGATMVYENGEPWDAPSFICTGCEHVEPASGKAFEAWLDATPSLKPYGNLLLSAWQARATLAAPSRSKRLAKAGFTRRPTGKTVGGLMRETAADKPDDGDD
jgi:hypothetical protein